MGKTKGKPYLSVEKTYTCAGCGATGQGRELQCSPGSQRPDPNTEQLPSGWWVVHRIDPFPLDDIYPPDFACSEACARKAIGDRVGPPEMPSAAPVAAAPRTVQVDLFKLLDLAMLTYEERGMTGAMLRAWIFERAGFSITKEEIAQYVEHKLDAQFQTHLARDGLTKEQWIAKWEAMNPGKKWASAVETDDDGEVAYVTKRVTEIVDRMNEERRFELNLRRGEKGV